MRNVVLSLCGALLLACGPAAAQATPDLHISDGREIGLPWQVDDGKGFRWDISQQGVVQNGTNSAYSSAMILRFSDGQQFSAPNGRGRLDGGEREIEAGPMKLPSGVQVWRRVYVDPKLGYCRWIDIFENPIASTQAIDLEYWLHMGNSVQRISTTSNGAALEPRDWAFVTHDDPNSNRPAVVHVFGSRNIKQRPTVEIPPGNNRITYRFHLDIPAGQTQAVCFFECQRRTFEEAVKCLKTFRPERELQKVPSDLRRRIVNMGGALLSLGRADLPRTEQQDVIVLGDEKDETVVLGTLLNEAYSLETFFGPLRLPADRMLGLQVVSPSEGYVQAALTDGQIVAGRLTDGPLKMRLADGKEFAVDLWRMRGATYRVSPQRPEEVRLARPTLVLRSGEQVSFDPAGLSWDFQTEYGRRKLSPDDLREIRLDCPGGLHQAVFRNGSILSGLLPTGPLKVRLELDSEANLPQGAVQRIVLPGQDVETIGLSRVLLRNDDELFGRLEEETLTLHALLGDVTMKTANILRLHRKPETPDEFDVKLRDGTTVTGRLAAPVLRFTLSPGPELPLFPGHVVEIVCPESESPLATQPASQPSAGGGTGTR